MDPKKDQELLGQLQGETENSNQEGYLVLLNQSAVITKLFIFRVGFFPLNVEFSNLLQDELLYFIIL